MEQKVELPEPTFLWDRPEYPHYTPDQVRAAVLAERERWTPGLRISIPKETMEQEFQTYYRRGVEAERLRACREIERLADVISGPAESDGHWQLLHRVAAAIRRGD